MKNKFISWVIVFGIMIGLLSGCGTLSTTAKMKTDYSKGYSDNFIKSSEIIVKVCVILHDLAKQDLIPESSEDYLRSYKTYFDNYDNNTDAKQKEIVDSIKIYYQDYLKFAMIKQLDVVQQNAKETGENKITNEQMNKNLEENIISRAKQFEILKTDMHNLQKFFK